MPTKIKGQPNSAEVIAKLKAEDRPVLLAFSCGKDSIATWIALEDAGIEVVPVYMYCPPGLKFVEDEIAYFEGRFGVKIHQMPHPSMSRMLHRCVAQAPENLPILEATGIGEMDYAQVWDMARDAFGLAPDTWVCDGVRAADSIVRRASLTKHGVMKPSSRKVSPIADWLKGEVMDAIARRGIELPIDYEIFGRSFDGLDNRFIRPLRDHLPEDYERLCEWFPLLETDILRCEHYGI